MKSILAIFFIVSIFLISFTGYNSRWLRCPLFQKTRLHYTTADHHYHQSSPTNITHVLFGIGGSVKTWNSRRHYIDTWWKPNITRRFVWLDQPPENDTLWSETSPPYKLSSDTSKFKYTSWYGSRSAIRIGRIVKESFELGLPNVRWFVFGDDDTVFFVENLVTVLGKYDHNEMYYVGGNSESVEQDVIHSYAMAYGGGGFAISYPLAAAVVGLLDRCLDRYASLYGSDQKVQGCISEIGVPLTRELGFHQMDIKGNPYGLLAAHPIASFVSLHHLDYVEPIFPDLTRSRSLQKLLQPYKHDPGRTLQQSFCYDLRRNWSVSVSWGFTVQLYLSKVTPRMLETPLHTFVTWRSWSQEPFTFNTRIVNLDSCDGPMIFFLDRVWKSGRGWTRTTYTQMSNESGSQCDKEGYLRATSINKFDVLAAKFGHDTWKKAPRRQCCEIISGKDELDDTVRVRIKGCHRFESVTPPL